MSKQEGMVIDLFAGGGGASVGLEAALGRKVDAAINHWDVALAVHEVNHPRTKHYTQDIWEVSPRMVTGGRPVDVLWASPDCFPAGTLVLTREGYRPIEEIELGDEVLTHKRRWRRVTHLMKGRKSLVRVDVQGHPDGIVSSDGHGYYAAPEKGAAPEKIRAASLPKGAYLAAPLGIDEERKVPKETHHVSPWMMGLHVADGWADPQKGWVITLGKHEAEEAEGLLKAHSSQRWTRRETETAVQFTNYKAARCRWLREQFGHLAHNKRLPGWLFEAPRAWQEAFLKGYVYGDGHETKEGLTETCTVSRELAIGIATLARMLGYTVSSYVQPQRPNAIEGREVNLQPFIYTVKWRESVDEGHRQQWDADGHRFYPRRTLHLGAGEDVVYNITVDEDHTYVVEGFVVFNCTHFSVAKGGKPRSDKIRSLAWVVVKWAKQVRPKLIGIENVGEFTGWGPLDEDGFPIKSLAGSTFEEWVKELEFLGYSVDWKMLTASHYGVPTRRRRLFVVARLDGAPVEWPEPTHGKEGLQPEVPAAAIVDWNLPCQSIFERKKPLAAKTEARIAEGLRRYVLECDDPFIVGSMAPTLIQTGYGERKGQRPRVPGLDKPLGTLMGGGQKHALVGAQLLNLTHGGRQEPIDEPMRTVTAAPRGEKALVSSHLVHLRGTGTAKDVRETTPTVTAGGTHIGLASAWMAKHYGGVVGQGMQHPIGSVTGRDSHAICRAELGGEDRTDKVRAFLTTYYGSGSVGQSLNQPLRTVTSKARLGLVTIHGVEYQITDIGMRMLQPHELLAAQFGEYSMDYTLDVLRPADDSPITKTEKIKLIGNSVPPELVRQVIGANLHWRKGWKTA